MPNQSTRQYVVFNETPLREFLGKQQERPADVPDERRLPLTAADIKRVLAALFEGIELEQVSVPLVTFVPGDDPCVLEPTQGVFAVTTDGPDAARRFQAVLDQVNKDVANKDAMLLRVGVDPAVALSEYSVPVAPGADAIGTWQDALDLINAQTLADKDLYGEGVNIVVVDAGFDKSILDGTPAIFGGGWQIDPGDPQLPPSLPPA